MPTARFTITIQYKHSEGKFQPKDAIIDAIREELEHQYLDEVLVDEATYEIEDWSVEDA